MNNKITNKECWNLDWEIMKFITPRLKKFRKMKRHGYPIDFKSKRLWDKTLDKMIWSFDELLKSKFNARFDKRFYKVTPIIDHKKFQKLLESKKPFKIPYKREGIFDTKAYNRWEKKLNIGLELFNKHWRNLWD